MRGAHFAAGISSAGTVLRLDPRFRNGRAFRQCVTHQLAHGGALLVRKQSQAGDKVGRKAELNRDAIALPCWCSFFRSIHSLRVISDSLLCFGFRRCLSRRLCGNSGVA